VGAVVVVSTEVVGTVVVVVIAETGIEPGIAVVVG
jgi:hypothetical protein